MHVRMKIYTFDVLTKVDRASMHYGIEARAYYQILIDICLSNNNKDHFFNNNQSKSVLRDIVKDLKLLYYSYPKRGFGILSKCMAERRGN